MLTCRGWRLVAAFAHNDVDADTRVDDVIAALGPPKPTVSVGAIAIPQGRWDVTWGSRDQSRVEVAVVATVREAVAGAHPPRCASTARRYGPVQHDPTTL